MAMIKCTECGHMVSDKANTCPECGCPVSEILREIHKKSILNRNSDGSVEIGSIADALCKILDNCQDDWHEVSNYYHERTKGSSLNKAWWVNNFYFLLHRYLTEEAVKEISDDPAYDYQLLRDYINTRFNQKDKYGNFVNPNLRYVLYIVGKKNGLVMLDNLDELSEQEWIVTHSKLNNITLEQVQEWFPSAQADKIHSLIMTETIPGEYNSFYYNEWEYLVSTIFCERKPKYEDNFGAFDICDLIKEKYNSSDDIYSVVSIVNAHIKSIDHAKLTHGKMSYRTIEFDGRTPNYGNYEYVEDYKHDRIVGSGVREYHATIFESDPERALTEMIQYAQEQIAQSFELAAVGEYRKDGFRYGDRICFTETELRMAKEQHDAEAVKYDKRIDDERAIKESIQMREKIIASTTVTPVIAGQIMGAKCPNCGKETVRKISSIKRAASIGLFGKFSTNIAKTMECASCGYKW